MEGTDFDNFDFSIFNPLDKDKAREALNGMKPSSINKLLRILLELGISPSPLRLSQEAIEDLAVVLDIDTYDVAIEAILEHLDKN